MATSLDIRTSGQRVPVASCSPGSKSSGARQSLLRMFCILLGCVLMTAGTLKLLALATSPGLLPDQTARGGPWLLLEVGSEMLMGCLLVVVPSALWVQHLALVTFLLLSGVAFYEVLVGAQSCGCFGHLRVRPWQTAAFDVAAVLGLIILRHGKYVEVDSPRMFRPWPASAACLAVLTVGTASWAILHRSATITDLDGLPVSDGVTIVEPQRWLGKPFPLEHYIDVPAKLMAGNWVVVLYRWDCEHCRAAMPGYEAMARRSRGDPGAARVALIEVPPFAPPGQGIVHADCGAALGRLSDSGEWFVQTPSRIEIRQGKVVGAEEGK